MRSTFTRCLRGSICLYCSLLFFGHAGAQTLTPRYTAISSDNPGFYEWLPKGYSATAKQGWPLMIFFNGSGDFGNGDPSELVYVLKNGPGRLMKEGEWPDSFTVRNKTFRFIVILPEFEAVPTLGQIDSVMNYALAHYNVDTTRIYMTGLSSGGNNTWWYASASSDRARRLAAIVPISAGELWTGEAGAQVMASADLAIFAAANQYDSTIPCINTIQAIGLINSIIPAINPIALDTIYDATGHDAWTETYDPNMNLHNGLNVYQWMLQYSRGASDSSAPPVVLPIQLSSFIVTYLAWQQEVSLTWTTTAGTAPYFLVQRSTDGQTFNAIDTVKPDTGTGIQNYYSVVDAGPLPGVDYYRLELITPSGAVSYSAIREVDIPKPSPVVAESFRISPNPSSGTLTLDLSDTASGALEVRLIDLQGRTIRTWMFQKQSPSWHQSIDVGDLDKGNYFIQVFDKDRVVTQPFIKL